MWCENCTVCKSNRIISLTSRSASIKDNFAFHWDSQKNWIYLTCRFFFFGPKENNAFNSSIVYYHILCILFSTGAPNLWDLMPDDLRWNRCNDNRNKIHSKCKMLESFWNDPLPPPVHGKIVFPETVLWWQNVGNHRFNT